MIFYGSDGAVINKEEQALKPELDLNCCRGSQEACSTISIEAGVDASEPSAIGLTRLEIYDVHTGTKYFISIAPDTSTAPPNRM